MVRLAAERRKMSKMIKDTLMLLVKNGLTFSDRFTIEALIGITVDEGDVMLVSMNELIQSDTLKDKNETNQDSHSSKKQSKSRRDKHKKRAVVETEEIVSSENEDYELIVKAEQSPKKRSRVERSEVTRPSEGVTPKASHMSLTLVPPDESLEGKPKQIDNGDKDDDSYTNNDVIIKSEVSEVDVEWPDFPLDDTSHPGTSDGDQPIFSSNLLDSGGQGDSQPGTSQQISHFTGGGMSLPLMMIADEDDVSVCESMFGPGAVQSTNPPVYPVTIVPNSIIGTMYSTDDSSHSFQPRTRKKQASTETAICPICDKDFTYAYAGSLSRHVREQHSRVKHYYVCPIQDCKSKMARKNEIKRHLMNCHQVRDPATLNGYLDQIDSLLRQKDNTH